MTSLPTVSDQQIQVFPPERGIGVLAVDPPYPVGFKPQTDGALGININMVYGDRDGLLCYILAYVAMVVGDNIKVYIGTSPAPVAQFTVTDAHFDAQGNAKNIPFYISSADMEARFVVSQNQDFWFVVQRVSGNTEKSPVVPLFYKHPAPGEADTDGGKPFNQGLKLPVASESLVDQTVIKNGMFVTVLAYFKQQIGDVLVLAFGSLTLHQTVTALGDVVFELTPELLATLPPTDSLVVRWEVADVVENFSYWSDALYLTFKPGIVLLAAPIFEAADADNVVDHDALLGAVMNILLTGVFAINDVIDLILTGLTQGGDTVTYTYSRKLTAAGRALTFAVENERVRNLIGGSLRASYTLKRAGKIQTSKPADATISGTSQPLGLPTVEPLVAGKLPADTAMATVTFAEYGPLKEGAIAEVRWQTTDEDGIGVLFVFQQLVSDPSLPIVLKVPAKYIASYANTPLTVQCTLTNPDQLQVFSGLLQLMIGEEAKIELSPPTLVAPVVSPIDVFKYPAGVNIQVEYLAALAGDRARLVEPDAPTGSSGFPLVEFDQNKRTTTVLTPAFLAARQGKSFALRWNLNRKNTLIGKSPLLSLTVLKIADGDARMPKPILAGVTGNELDVTKLLSSDQCRVEKWPFQAVGQFVWLRYDGFNTQGVAISYVDLRGEVNTSEQGLTRLAPVEWLKQLKGATEVKVTCKVNLDGKADEASAVTFPVCTYLVKSAPPLSFDTRPMLLAGLSVKANWPRTGFDSVGNTEARVATGGVPPFTYVSSNPGVASVTPDGKVTGNANGAATIRVTDQRGASLSCSVTVSNVYRLAINESSMTYQQSLNWMYSLPNSAPVTTPAVYDMQRVYGHIPAYKHYWLCEKGACQNFSVGFAFFHFERRAIYCADAAANYPGAWCLLRT